MNFFVILPIWSFCFFVQHPGTTIVTDSVTSDGLTTFIEKKLGIMQNEVVSCLFSVMNVLMM